MSISNHKLAADFFDLSNNILQLTTRGVLRTDFLREVSKMLLDFSGCHMVELLVTERSKQFVCEAMIGADPSLRVTAFTNGKGSDPGIVRLSEDRKGFDWPGIEGLRKKKESSFGSFTANGSFWTGDARNLIAIDSDAGGQALLRYFRVHEDCRSIAVIPFHVEDDIVSFLQLKSREPDCFGREIVELYEGLARTLGVALVFRRAQLDLRERVKELTCLYGIAQFVGRREMSRDEMLQKIAELLPPAWLYPEIASGSIVFDGSTFLTAGFKDGPQRQSADIFVQGRMRGSVEVVYSEERPEIDEGPFLKEERDLIDAVAREISLILGRRESDDARAVLEEQLRHADRLATIGQLAAGVAHELNEPLGGILGFAQLAKKDSELPAQAAHDIDKIISASLHAREVVRELLVFARQVATNKTDVEINRIIDDVLSLFESRLRRDGIEIIKYLAPDLPRVTADPAQLKQVLINLIVNGTQAMSNGGHLTIRSGARGDRVTFGVEDTGLGMSEEIRKQIFIPFFTTKDVGKGTGLGLSVVHGIVTSHGGSISVESEVGRGTRIEIELPAVRPGEIEEKGT